jgi:hypothetical protein
MILVFPTPLAIVQDIYGEMVVGRPFRAVGEGDQSAFLVKGFSPNDGSVPDLHADPVSGLQFVNTFKGHAQPSTPVKLLMRRALSWMLMIRRAATSAQPRHVQGARVTLRRAGTDPLPARLNS